MIACGKAQSLTSSREMSCTTARNADARLWSFRCRYQINHDRTVRVYKDALQWSPQRRTVSTEIPSLLGRCIP